MALTLVTRLGAYEITAQIGVGSGEVSRKPPRPSEGRSSAEGPARCSCSRLILRDAVAERLSSLDAAQAREPFAWIRRLSDGRSEMAAMRRGARCVGS